jgi:hypothetical protein
MSNLEALIEQAFDEFAESGRYAPSTFCGAAGPGETVEALLERIVREAHLPHGQIRITTAGELMDRGFHLVQTGNPSCHYDVDLGETPTLDAVERFERAFGEARRNPCR